MDPALGPDGQPVVMPSHAGRENPSLYNTNAVDTFRASVATVHSPAGAPAPQPVRAARGYPVEVQEDTNSVVEAIGEPSYAWTNEGGSRHRVDHDPDFERASQERVLRVNERTRAWVDYHPFADQLRDSDADPGRTMVQRAFTIRDWFGPYLMDFTGAKSRPIVIARETFGAATMFEQDPRINRNRPFPESYGDQTGEPC